MLPLIILEEKAIKFFNKILLVRNLDSEIAKDLRNSCTNYCIVVIKTTFDVIFFSSVF